MVDFAGWELPVRYKGVMEEHLAVRTRAGLFDVSHMGEATVTGPEALDFLQWVTCNDVARISTCRAQYNALTLPNGGFVDDLLVYRLDEEEYLLVLNASNTVKDLSWLKEQVRGRDVRIADVSSEWALMALQGPRSVEILQGLAVAELAGLRYFSLIRTEIAGAPCIISRTGYTGEDGFEIFLPPSRAEETWHALLEAGGACGLIPAGLGARDTLRLEAKLALYGNDIDESTTVLEADLGWIVKLDKGEFVGREALAREKQEGATRKLVGFEMRGRGIARPGYPAVKDGEMVGKVTSGSHAPYLKKNIGLVYLPRGMWTPGTHFEIEIRGRREAAVVVSTPFYKRSR